MLGADFSDQCTTVTVPAATTPGSQTYTIPTFFTVVDDNINEVEQKFVIVAEIGDDVPSNCFVEGVGLSDCSCFQTQVGEIECLGRSGATKIRITDNDCKNNTSTKLQIACADISYMFLRLSCSLYAFYSSTLFLSLALSFFCL